MEKISKLLNDVTQLIKTMKISISFHLNQKKIQEDSVTDHVL